MSQPRGSPPPPPPLTPPRACCSYFPPGSLNREYFKDSATHSTCGWKGVASYYTIEVDGKINKDAAWYYPSTTTDRAKQVEGRVAFWKGVQVVSD